MPKTESPGFLHPKAWRGRLIRAAGYAVAFVLLFALDNAVESIGGADKASAAQKYSKIFSPSVLYPRLTGAGSRGGYASHTAIVIVEKAEVAKPLGVSCGIRLLVGDVINALQNVSPAAIVVDRGFNAHGCESELTNSRLASQLTSSRVPVILGQPTETFDDFRTKQPLAFRDMRKRGFSENELVISQPVPFTPKADALFIGLMRLDYDNQKIPLSWYVSGSDGIQSGWHDSLAAAAVKATRPSQRIERQLGQLQASHRNPIGSFFKEDQFPLMSAFDVVCNNPSTARSWIQCKDWKMNNSPELTAVKGRVVVVGVVDPEGQEDVQDSAIGKVSGVVLQANYIESLLGNTFLKSVPAWAQIAIGVCWFILIEMILRRWHGSPLRTVVYPIIIIGGLWIIVSICLLFVGIYVELLFPSILVIIVAHITKQIEDTLEPKARVSERQIWDSKSVEAQP